MIQRVLVTGAVGGIGRSVIEKFTKGGWTVVGIDKTSDDIKTSKNISMFNCDLSNYSQITRLKDLIGNVQLDAIVNCVGKYFSGDIETTSEEDALNIMNDNFITVFNTVKAFQKNLKSGGSIVNVSSVNSWFPQRNSLIYNAMKGAVTSLTKSLATDLSKRNIRVNSVAPGSVLTPPLIKYIADRSTQMNVSEEKIQAEIGRLHLLGRLAYPEEIANVVYFLATSESSFITGTEITVDGGLTIRSET